MPKPAVRSLEPGRQPAPTLYYCYDGHNVIAEYDFDAATPLQRYYLHGTQYIDERAVMLIYDPDEPDEEYYYFTGALYTVEGLVNDRGREVERYTYDAYGKTTIWAIPPADLTGNEDINASDLAQVLGAWHNPCVNPPTDINGNGDTEAGDYNLILGAWGAAPVTQLPESYFGNTYAFTGRRMDFFDYDGGVPQHMLYHYRAREYDPVHGRFMQRDGTGYRDGGNLYEYARSTPMYYVDPQGLQATSSQPNQQRFRVPGTFDVLMGDTDRKAISTGVTVRYTPTSDQKKCCKMILLIQTADTQIIRNWAIDINKPPHIDAQKKGKHKEGEQPWPYYPHQIPGGCDGLFGKDKGECELDDDPGYEAEVEKLSQSYETCAVCKDGLLRGTNFGCTKWGHYKNKGQPLQRWGEGYAKPPQPPSQTFKDLLKKNHINYEYKE